MRPSAHAVVAGGGDRLAVGRAGCRRSIRSSARRAPVRSQSTSGTRKSGSPCVFSASSAARRRLEPEIHLHRDGAREGLDHLDGPQPPQRPARGARRAAPRRTGPRSRAKRRSMPGRSTLTATRCPRRRPRPARCTCAIEAAATGWRRSCGTARPAAGRTPSSIVARPPPLAEAAACGPAASPSRAAIAGADQVGPASPGTGRA